MTEGAQIEEAIKELARPDLRYSRFSVPLILEEIYRGPAIGGRPPSFDYKLYTEGLCATSIGT